LTHVLVEQHPEEQRERVAAQQLVGGGVLGEGQRRHTERVPHVDDGAITADDLTGTVLTVDASTAGLAQVGA